MSYPLQRLSALAAQLRVHVRAAWTADEAHAAAIDADLASMERELAALADAAMVQAATEKKGETTTCLPTTSPRPTPRPTLRGRSRSAPA